MKKRILSAIIIAFIMVLLLPGGTVMADATTFGFNTEETGYGNTISDTNSGYTLQIASSDPEDTVTNCGIEVAATSGDYAFLAPAMDGYAVYVGYVDWDTGEQYKPKGTITVSFTSGKAFSLDSFVCENPGEDDGHLMLAAGSATETFALEGLQLQADGKKIPSPPISITPSAAFHGITSFTLSWDCDSFLYFDNFKITPITNPVITTQPVNASAASGGNANFFVAAIGALSYQWQADTSGSGSSFTNVSNGGLYGGATAASLSIMGVTAGMNNYQYRCIVTGDEGAYSISDNAALRVIQPPTDIALDNASIAENTAAGTKVGGLTTEDPDSSIFAYSFVDTATYPDNACFTLSGSDLILNTVPDYESKSSYSIRIRTQDDTGQFYDKTFTISVTKAAIAPTITGPTTMSLSEGYSATSTGAYIITGTEPVEMIKTSGDDKIIWNNATKQLDIAAGLTAGSYPVILKASNGTSPDVTLTFTLTVTEFAGGDGSPEGTGAGPYQISNPAQLNNVRNHLNAHFELANDIDLTAYLSPGGAGYNGGKGWAPIHRYDAGTYTDYPFTGIFDGNHHTISGLMIDDNDEDDDGIGLFGTAGTHCVIRDLNIVVSGIGCKGEYVGALIGRACGDFDDTVDISVTNCHSTGGLISGDSYVGGLIGCTMNGVEVIRCSSSCDVKAAPAYMPAYANAGGLVGQLDYQDYISQSYATGAVTSSGSYTGGLVGNAGGSISNCYATGAVSGKGSAGGLIGAYLSYGGLTITNCYAAGAVTGTGSNFGGLIGAPGSGSSTTATSSYYNGPISGRSGGKGTSKTSAEMVQQNTYTGWNFTPVSGIWGINAGQSYPYLLGIQPNPLPAPPTLTISGSFTADSKTYDRANTAEIRTNNLTLSGVSIGDTVTLSAAAAFADKNVGTGKTVSLTSSCSLGGTKASKYILSLNGAPTATANITAKTLTVGGSFTANSKIYDGTDTATFQSNNLTLIDVINGDTVTLNAVIAFADENAGTGKTVSLTPSSSLTGTDASNYTLSLTGAPTATADITLLVSPAIIGPTMMSLIEGYSATSTDVYTITGTATVAVTKTSGDDKITWNDATKKLDIAAGLTAGSYPVVLKASNGISPDATLTFTLTVNPAPVAPTISGPRELTLTEGYEATSTGVYTITGIPAATVSKTSGDNRIIWNYTTKKLDIAAGLTAGSYPVVLTASNGISPDATLTFTLTVLADTRSSAKAITGFSINGVAGTINETDHTIAVTLPYGTDVTGLTPTITVSDKATVSPTSSAAQDFTNPVTYTVTAENETVQTYTVTVTVEAASVAPTITGPIELILNEGYSATSTGIYTITGIPAATVAKTSGDSNITWNDATKTLDIAAGLTAGRYPVVLKASNGILPDATLTFTLTVILPAANTGTITGTVTDGINPVSGANVSLTVSESVYSAVTAADGSYHILNVPAGTGYTVTADKTGYTRGSVPNVNVTANTTTFDVNITLTVLPDTRSSAKAITGFSINGVAGNINEANHTIAVTLPYETDITRLAPAITVSDKAAVSPASGAARDFTSPVTYTVTAENETTQTYTVTVTVEAAPPQTYSLTITAGTGGSITTGSSGNYAAGAVITIAATASANYSFDKWTANGGGSFANANSASTTFTMPANAVTITAEFIHNSGNSGNNGDNSSGSGGGTSTVPPPAGTPKPETPKTETTTAGNTVTATTTATATVDSSGRATAAVSQAQLTEAIGKAVAEATKQGSGAAAVVEIKIDAPAGITTVEASIPKEAVILAADSKIATLILATPIASISFDAKALSTIDGEAAEAVQITASRVEASSLTPETQQLVGDRPVFNFSVTSGDKTISQFGGNVSVAVPYTPKAGEDTNAIVIYYINAQGKAEIVSDCIYDPATGTVSFNTNHFSQYAVGYNKVNFKDVAADAWYGKAVGFIAARGITTGTGSGKYSPTAKLTRGEFLVMLMRAYGIAPDGDPKDNFADSGNTYYTGYLAAAKRLGISGGIGGNMFAPNKEITRQEMFTLLYNGLKSINRLPKGTGGKPLSAFNDAGQVASWAKDAMKLLAGTGAVSGNDGKLSPSASTTRAEMAQVLYNLLSK